MSLSLSELTKVDFHEHEKVTSKITIRVNSKFAEHIKKNSYFVFNISLCKQLSQYAKGMYLFLLSQKDSYKFIGIKHWRVILGIHDRLTTNRLKEHLQESIKELKNLNILEEKSYIDHKNTLHTWLNRERIKAYGEPTIENKESGDFNIADTQINLIEDTAVHHSEIKTEPIIDASCNTISDDFTLTPELLKESRKNAGLSQRKLAKEIGTSQQFLAQIEKGQRPVPNHLALKIQSILF